MITVTTIYRDFSPFRPGKYFFQICHGIGLSWFENHTGEYCECLAAVKETIKSRGIETAEIFVSYKPALNQINSELFGD